MLKPPLTSFARQVEPSSNFTCKHSQFVATVLVHSVSKTLPGDDQSTFIQVFHLPKAQAAQQLGIGVSTLKRCCTALRIKRWPHRKLGCLKQLLEYHALHPLPDDSAQQVRYLMH
jgi:hypothetical protein